jgi:hypothetical protein
MLQGLDTLLSIILWASYNQLPLFKPLALRCAGVVSLLVVAAGIEPAVNYRLQAIVVSPSLLRVRFAVLSRSTESVLNTLICATII